MDGTRWVQTEVYRLLEKDQQGKRVPVDAEQTQIIPQENGVVCQGFGRQRDFLGAYS
jgi:hypothetical protein